MTYTVASGAVMAYDGGDQPPSLSKLEKNAYVTLRVEGRRGPGLSRLLHRGGGHHLHLLRLPMVLERPPLRRAGPHLDIDLTLPEVYRNDARKNGDSVVVTVRYQEVSSRGPSAPTPAASSRR